MVKKLTAKVFAQMAASMEKHYRRTFVFSFDAKMSYITYFVNGMYMAYITASSRIFHENKAMTVEEFSKFNYSNYCAEITVSGEELKTIRFYNEFTEETRT